METLLIVDYVIAGAGLAALISAYIADMVAENRRIES